MKSNFNIVFALAFIAMSNHQPNSLDNTKIVDQFSGKSFRNNEIMGWEEKSFVGRTSYAIVEQDGNDVLHARADSAASGLFKEMKYDPKEWPILSWRWKAVQLPEKGDVRFKETDDYGARVYVVFPHFLKWKTKTISYIWAKQLPKGEHIPNPWLPKNAVMLAVQSGADSLGRWITEKRNVYDDFKKIFGSEPPNAGAIAIMSDSDNTGGVAEAFYDDIMLLKK
jgi:hypothetical protein